MINQEDLDKQLAKCLRGYVSSTEFVNDMYKYGLSRHSCMVLELLLLGRAYVRVQRVLLFTDDTFSGCTEEISEFLTTFKKKQTVFNAKTILPK